jgi:hypothetical protein
MPDTPVATEVHEPLDVHRRLASQVALDSEGSDSTAQLRDLRLRQILHLGVGGDTGSLTDLPGARPANTVDRRQRDHDVLVNWDVYACYTCHVSVPFELTLALLVTSVGTDHPNNAVTADDLAVSAHLLD